MSLARQNFSEASEAAINQQILVELTASYAYQSMSSWCARDTVSLPGFAAFLRECSEDERKHAQKLIDYMAARGGRVQLKPIPSPEVSIYIELFFLEIIFDHLDYIQMEWKTPMNILETALKYEKEVNQSLLNLHKIAEENEDPALEDFIESEFLEEQIKDIKELADMITQLSRCGDGLGLYIFDRDLAEKHK